MTLACSCKIKHLLSIVFATSLATTATANVAQKSAYFRIGIQRLGPQEVDALKTDRQVRFWIEADTELLVLAAEDAGARWPAAAAVERLEVTPKPEELYFVQGAHQFDLSAFSGTVLTHGGRLFLLQGTRPERPPNDHMRLLPFRPNMVLAKAAPRTSELDGERAQFSYVTRELMPLINTERWFSAVERLASWNRYAKGTGIIPAGTWLKDEFSALPGFATATEEFSLGSGKAFNVVATLKGQSRPDEIYIVGGHYDSISESPQTSAPGAEDNASGAAGVLELARVMALHPPEATVVFIAFSGEEQGLIGSRAYVAKLIAQGDKAKIKGVLTMDMIGYTGDADLDCLIETSSKNQAMVDALTAAAHEFTELRIVSSFNYWGSDHVPFIDSGIPAVLTIENDYESYPAYHRTSDRPSTITQKMGVEVLKMNLATLSTWVY